MRHDDDVAHEWMRDAACRGADINLFFRTEQSLALRICQGCEVREQCLAYALEHEQGDRYRAGVLGARTSGQRAELARER